MRSNSSPENPLLEHQSETNRKMTSLERDVFVKLLQVAQEEITHSCRWVTPELPCYACLVLVQAEELAKEPAEEGFLRDYK